MLPSAVNDTMRDMMAQIRDVGDGVRDGTYTMTTPKITGGTITGVTLTGNTLTNPVISGGTLTTSAFNGTVGATTASTGAFTTINASTSITNAGLTSGRVTYAGASGLLSDSANLTYDGTNLILGTGNRLLVSRSTSDANNWGVQVTGSSAYTNGIQLTYSGVGASAIWVPAASSLAFGADGASGTTERMRLNSTGLGIGTSSPGTKISILATNAPSPTIGTASGGFSLLGTDGLYGLYSGVSDSGNSWFQAMRNNSAISYDLLLQPSGGNVGIGTSSPARLLTLFNSTAPVLQLTNTASGSTANDGMLMYQNGADFSLDNQESGYIRFNTAATERVRIDSSGNLLVGTTSASGKLTVRATGTENVGNQIASFKSDTSDDGVIFFLSSGTAHGSASLPTIAVNKNVSTGRSINAEGTINASGTDYAEYMTKSGNFTIAKGDVVGINAQGKLTNVFSEAISFVVKSTNPSYVGGDSWGSVDAIGKRPDNDAPQSEKDSFELALENARQTVDRIAFCGQVPVNVTSATVGQYIIPFNDNGAIKGIAVNENDLTMSQYIKSVGKVIKVVDGKPTIIVKVA